MKAIVLAVIAALLAGVLVLKQKAVNDSAARNGELTDKLAKIEAALTQTQDLAAQAQAQLKKAEEERGELIKLRGEVTSLRREKEAWDKRQAEERKAIAAAAQTRKSAAETEQAGLKSRAEDMANFLNSPSTAKGAALGDLRRKILSRETLNETELSLLQTMLDHSRDIEKSPEEFANFQTSFVSSLLGWNNDPRADEVRQMLTRASSVAIERGFDYHQPGQNAENWPENQKALNARATGAVQKLLTPEEREVFDKAFLGVLGIDFGMAGNTR